MSRIVVVILLTYHRRKPTDLHKILPAVFATWKFTILFINIPLLFPILRQIHSLLSSTISFRFTWLLLPLPPNLCQYVIKVYTAPVHSESRVSMRTEWHNINLEGTFSADRQIVANESDIKLKGEKRKPSCWLMLPFPLTEVLVLQAGSWEGAEK
jgi:hypothetical protein